MKSILDEIVNNKRKEISNKEKEISLQKLKEDSSLKSTKTRNFRGAILSPKQSTIALIAEIKLASPSEGVLGSIDEVLEKVLEYEKEGADAISVVVDKKYFNGSFELLEKIKNVVSLPILAKDFVISEYQLYEAKKAGADAILLIVKILDGKKLFLFVEKAYELGMEPVLEIQNEKELEKALITKANFIAVNARDLHTFEIDIKKACKLGMKIPTERFFLGFSGVKQRSDVVQYTKSGAYGVLVGTSLMKAKRPGEMIKDLKNV